MAIRLTKAMKDQIVSRLMDHAYAARKAALDAEELALGSDIYDDVYTHGVRAKMADLPKDYLRTTDRITVQISGHGSPSIRFGDVSLGNVRRIAHLFDGNAAKRYDSSSPFTARFVDWKAKQVALLNEEDTATKDARQILDSVATLSKLIEVWPEVRQFVQDFLPAPAIRAQSPMLPISDVNKNLGLK